MSKDYYKILDVDRNATAEEVKKAYRKMAMKHHPDKNDGDIDSESKFKEAAEAYDVLSNPQKKSNYDQYGTVDGNPFGGGGNPFSGFGGGFSMDDIFSQFGDVFGQNKNRSQKKRRGGDLRLKVSLTIEEILKGITKKIKYKRQISCNSCNGKGGRDVRDCIPCNGTGRRVVVQNTPFGQIRQEHGCPDCGASGKKVMNPCVVCKGEGTVSHEELVNIDIPAGVSSGMVLNMQKYGNHIKDGIPGDLQILVEEIREFYFKREGSNILIEKEISVIDAIIGAQLRVKTPHGEVPITIQPGTEHGQQLRVFGKGVPDINLGLGDLIIKVSLKIPKNVTQEEKSVLEKLKESNNFTA